MNDSKSSENDEPLDDKMYEMVGFYGDTFRFFREGVLHHRGTLCRDIEAIEKVESLRLLLSEQDRRSLDVYNELAKADRVLEWFDDVMRARGDSAVDYTVGQMSHRLVRYVKTTGTLYIRHLESERNQIASNQVISRHTLKTVDARLSKLRGLLELGIFADASPLPFLVEAPPIGKGTSEDQAPSTMLLDQSREQPPMMVLDSIEIRDPELKRRCLDLFQLFSEQGSEDRLDTVITEATRILEDRIRRTSRAGKLSGQELANAAFHSEHGTLRLSDNKDERQAAHLLYKGVFGFIRNPVHHRLVRGMDVTVAIQLLGFIDYLIHLAEGAEGRTGHAKQKE